MNHRIAIPIAILTATTAMAVQHNSGHNIPTSTATTSFYGCATLNNGLGFYGQIDVSNGFVMVHSPTLDATFPIADIYKLSKSETPTHSEFGNPIQEDIPDIRTNQYMVEQGVPVYRRQGAPQPEP